MPTMNDFPARGQVTQAADGTVTFNPAGTNYELKLKFAGPYTGPLNSPVDVYIRVDARKVYTVPSGGNFIAPIAGPPRILQGRVKFADDKILVVQAGVPVIVSLPSAESAIDLDSGPVGVGLMVNVVAAPGARLELAAKATAVA